MRPLPEQRKEDRWPASSSTLDGPLLGGSGTFQSFPKRLAFPKGILQYIRMTPGTVLIQPIPIGRVVVI